MKLLAIGADAAALAAMLGTVTNIVPTIVGVIGALYALLSAINYAFVIHDRIKYGPEIDNRQKRIK